MKKIGRKPLPQSLKKVQTGIALPGWINAWMRSRPESKARLIEHALKTTYQLEPPND